MYGYEQVPTSYKLHYKAGCIIIIYCNHIVYMQSGLIKAQKFNNFDMSDAKVEKYFRRAVQSIRNLF